MIHIISLFFSLIISLLFLIYTCAVLNTSFLSSKCSVSFYLTFKLLILSQDRFTHLKSSMWEPCFPLPAPVPVMANPLCVFYFVFTSSICRWCWWRWLMPLQIQGCWQRLWQREQRMGSLLLGSISKRIWYGISRGLYSL